MSQTAQVEAAARQLVQSLLKKGGATGDEEAEQDAATAWSMSIVQSSLGIRSTSGRSRHEEEALAWRRIQRRIQKQNGLSQGTEGDKHQQRRLYALYQQFKQSDLNRQSRCNDDDDLPSQMLCILSKLVGQKNQQRKRLQCFTGNDSSALLRLGAKTQAGTTLLSPPPPLIDENCELLLLHDCFYCLQGISGEYLHFDSLPSNTSQTLAESYIDVDRLRMIQIKPNCKIDGIINFFATASKVAPLGASGAMDALRICGEAGWLYQRIQSFIDNILEPATLPVGEKATTFHRQTGAVARAMALALREQLQDYHELVAQLEGHLRRQQNNSESSKTALTLRQLVLRLRGPTRQLHTLAMITDGLLPPSTSRSTPLFLPACYVLSSLVRHAQHGDSRYSQLAHHLLLASCQPWWEMLFAWTTQGLLNDPFDEFFVTSQMKQQQQYHQQRRFRDDLWQDGYSIDNSKVPHGILDPPLIPLALSVGRGIHFIRKCLGDTEWTLQWDSSVANNTTAAANGEDPLSLDGITTTMDLKEQLGFCHGAQHSITTDLSPPSPLNQKQQQLSNSFLLSHPTLLHHTLAHAAEQVHTHILHVLTEEYHMFQHLWALKQFLFMGQGDFASTLMEAIWQQQAELNEDLTIARPRPEENDHNGGNHRTQQQQYHVLPKYTLLAIMDGALKSTNAKDMPLYVVERLQVKIMEQPSPQRIKQEVDYDHDDDPSAEDYLSTTSHDPNDEEVNCNFDTATSTTTTTTSCWDGFQLDYTVPEPLSAIVHADTMMEYRLVFSFLFRLKSVEFRLDTTWRQSAAIQHALQIYCQYNGIRLASSEGYSQATILLRHVSMTRQSMMHLVRNWKSYIMLEVIEGGWKDLVQRLEAAKTLDQVVEAHDDYLQGIIRKCWLLRPGRHNVSSNQLAVKINNTTSTHQVSDQAAKRHWHKLLYMVDEFCSFQELVFTESLQAAERATEKRREAEQRLKQGQWGFQQEALEEESFFFLADSTKLHSVIRMSEAFHQGVMELLQVLHETVNRPGDRVAEDHDGNWSNNWDDQNDHDSLRFLMLQLDCNNFYSSVSLP